MATDGPDPKPCDPEMYENGVVVGVFETYGSNHFQGLVEEVSKTCGRSVDWHFFGGRAVVKTFPEDSEFVKPFVEKIIRSAINAKSEEFLQDVYKRMSKNEC